MLPERKEGYDETTETQSQPCIYGQSGVGGAEGGADVGGSRALCLEHVKMGVGPAHSGLQRQVQAVEANISGHLQSAGDGGFDTLMRDLDFDDAHDRPLFV